jgi:hypothetical protein
MIVRRAGRLRLPMWLPVPDPVQSFIEDFDEGKFPELLRDGEDREIRRTPAI